MGSPAGYDLPVSTTSRSTFLSLGSSLLVPCQMNSSGTKSDPRDDRKVTQGRKLPHKELVDEEVEPLVPSLW